MAADIHGTEGPGAAPGSRRGVAIMMVVLILAALISIAGPFAISMHIYERNARHFRDTVRARLAAEGAVAHAISCLRRTEDAAEAEARYGAPWNTPDVDTQEELDVFFSFGGDNGKALEAAGVKFDDPKGVMWSANVEDEQGKVNLISAAPRVLGSMLRSANLAVDTVPGASVLVLDDASIFDSGDGPGSSGGEVCMGLDTVLYTHVSGDRLEGARWNIDPTSNIKKYQAGTLVYDAAAKKIADEGVRGHFKTLFELKEFLSPRDFEVIQPYVTVNSYRDTSEGWLTRVAITGGFSGASRQFRVRSVAGFGQGARVRITAIREGTDEVLNNVTKRILWARQRGQWGYFRLYTGIGFNRPPDSIVHAQAEQFHPVNVNTARPSVLTALFAGLGEGRQRVTRLEAEAVADYIYYYVRRDERFVQGGRPVGSHADFRAMLEALRRSGWLENGISRAKLDAIIQDATATICFKAFGNFTIEAAGAVNTPVGEESARHVIRELVSMPVDSGGEFSISSQKDFDEQALRLVAPKTDTWPFSEPPTRGSALDVYKRGFDPRSGRDTHGYVTLDTGWAGGGKETEHFDARSGRWRGGYLSQHGAAVVKGGTLTRAGGDVFEKSGDYVKPFTFEGWFRLDGGIPPGLAAGEENRNGLRLSYLSVGESGRPEYLLTVADASADQGNTQRPWVGPAEFRFEAPRVDPGDWYHLAMQVKGTSPGEALVWMDAVVSRGSLSSYHPGTRLAQSLPVNVAEVGQDDDLLSEGDSVVVESTDDFPPRGTIIVDGEVMEYWENPGGSFEECRRARRYTHLAAHPTGAVVTPYGYSVPLDEPAYPCRGVVSAGVGELGPNPDGDPWRGPETKIIKKPIDEARNVYELLDENATTIEVEDTDGFQSSGYLRISGLTRQAGEPDLIPDPNNPARMTNQPRGRTWYVFYGGTSNNSFTECRYAPPVPVGQRHPMEGREFMLDGKVTLRQVSIAVTAASSGGLSRLKHNNRAVGRRSEFIPDDADPDNDAYACLIDDPDDPDSFVEWVSVDHKETVGGVTYIMGTRWYKWHDDYPGVYRPRDDWHGWRARRGTVFDPQNPDTPGPPFEELPVGTRLLPVFRVRGPQCGDWDSPRGYDFVTLVQGERAEEEPRRITHAHCAEWTHRPNSQSRWRHGFRYRVSLDDTISADYPAGNGRILKFPSGEFLRKIPEALRVGGANGAGFAGAIDELRTDKEGVARSLVLAPFFTETKPPFTNNEPVVCASGETTLTLMAEMATDGALTPTSGGGRGVGVSASNNGGVVKIGDELIWYKSWTASSGSTKAFIPWGKQQRTDDKFCPYHDCDDHAYDDHFDGCTRYMQTITLDGCVRGILGSDRVQSDHAAGERVTFFEGVPLTILRDALARGGDDLRIEADLKFPSEGYAIITDPNERASPGRGEIVGWTSGGGTSFQGCRYFRGRYGTPERGNLSGDFCQLLPFRYWDRYNYDFDDETELAYFQCSYVARDARWHEIEWQESGYTGGSASDRVRLRIVCRFDGKPDWNERPTNSQGGLWEFTGGGRQYFRSAGGGPLIADSIEVRAYWEYLGGAWDVDANDWKRNVRLDNLTVKFGNPLIVRKVDLLDY
ncbi:MAG: hypothetical protein ACYS9X_08265 [Planctomycetota bacterium]|jgi:hypothetical protein